jgi:hypothetical protein
MTRYQSLSRLSRSSGRIAARFGLNYSAGMGPEWLVVVLLVAVVIGILYLVQRSRRPR